MAVKLQADSRENKRKSTVRQIRQSGRVPGVIYGKDIGNKLISVDAVEMMKVLRDEGNYAVMELDIKGDQPHQVMVYDVQKDLVKNQLVHLDFKTIRMDEPIDSEVIIDVIGEPAGAKEGGVLQQSLRYLEVRCLPGDRPDAIECHVESLNIGDSLSVADLSVPEKVEVLTDSEDTVVTIVPPAREEDLDADADEAAEPELVDKTDDDEE